MNKRRMLAIHDVSCVGRCSLTVALPVISAAGIECSVLPTSVLSTHTGGFDGFTFRDLTEDIAPIMNHWKSLDLGFDSFYTGFLGSKDQIDLVIDLIEQVSDDSTVYVDPVMGDEGKLYTVFDGSFPKEMYRLSEKADVLIPNITELCFMLGLDYKPGVTTREFTDDLLDKAKVFGLKKIVITGISYEDGKVGSVYKDYATGECGTVMRGRIEGYYHGSGDVFSSALVASLESGIGLKRSVLIATDFTVDSIARTHDSGADTRYGLDFEQELLGLARRISDSGKELSFEIISSESGISRLAGMAANIWREAFREIISDEQIEYMINKFQSFRAMKKQIADEGYAYCILRLDDEDVGYMGFQMQDRMFLSKLYIRKEYRGLGLASKAVDFLSKETASNGLKSIYLTVNKGNGRAIEAYKAMGFKVVDEQCKDIGSGFVMDDYIMQLDL